MDTLKTVVSRRQEMTKAEAKAKAKAMAKARAKAVGFFRLGSRGRGACRAAECLGVPGSRGKDCLGAKKTLVGSRGRGRRDNNIAGGPGVGTTIFLGVPGSRAAGTTMFLGVPGSRRLARGEVLVPGSRGRRGDKKDCWGSRGRGSWLRARGPRENMSLNC
jgi:hypothetical protein